MLLLATTAAAMTPSKDFRPLAHNLQVGNIILRPVYVAAPMRFRVTETRLPLM